MNASLPFVDPVDGALCVAHFGDAPGIEHPGCLYRAEVSVELDAFYCRYCGYNGRISGAWFVSVLLKHQADWAAS